MKRAPQTSSLSCGKSVMKIFFGPERQGCNTYHEANSLRSPHPRPGDKATESHSSSLFRQLRPFFKNIIILSSMWPAGRSTFSCCHMSRHTGFAGTVRKLSSRALLPTALRICDCSHVRERLTQHLRAKLQLNALSGCEICI